MVHLTSINRPAGVIKISPLQVCLRGSNAVAEGGSKFDCLRIVKKSKVRYTWTEAGGEEAKMVKKWW